MKTSKRLSAQLARTLFGLAVLAGTAAVGHAQSTWDGGAGGIDNSWGNGANWVGDQVPVFPTGLIFGGSVRPTPTNNLTNPTVQGLTFASGAAAFTVGGSGITVGPTLMDATFLPGATNGGAANSSSANQVVSLPLALARGRHRFATDTGAGNLTLSGAITRDDTATAHFIVGGGAINTTLTNNATGLIGGWAAVGTDAATASWAARDGSGNIVPFTAFSHTFASDAFPAGTTLASNVNFTGGGPLTIPSGAQLSTMLFSELTTTVTAMTVTDTLTFANGGGLFRTGEPAAQHTLNGGTITAGTTGPATLHLRTRASEFGFIAGVLSPGSNPPESLNIGSVITNNAGGGAVTVVKSGFGVMRLTSANTFTGGIYINEGQLRPTVANAMGDPASPVHVAQDSQVLLGAGVDFPNPMFLAGFGPVENGAQPTEFRGGALRFNSAGGIISNTVTLTADAMIGARGGQATTGPGGTVSGKITGGFALRFNRQSGQGGAASVSSLDANMPTVTLANSANDWTGDTSIGRGRVRVGGTGEVIPDGPGKGNVDMVGEQAGSGTILNLAGHTETVNGLSSSGDATLIFITNSEPGTTATLRAGNNNATSTFAGTITENFAVATSLTNLTKLGSGTLTLTGDNFYNGDTRVYGGTLSITDPGADDLANTADVHLTAGSTLNLNFSGTDIIDSLYLNGVGQVTGTWGSLASTATNKSAFFTGSGVLQVSAVGTPLLAGDFDGDKDVDLADLDQWKRDFGVNGGSDANYDGDSDGGDFLIWQRNLGMTIPGVAAGGAVPEPGALALAGLAAIGLAASRQRRW